MKWQMAADQEPMDHYGEALEPGARSPAIYAASAIPSRGRMLAEPTCPTRTPFQRDRDRILHSSAFRRLTHKTQVFIFHEGDHYRSRLTHSLEVAQIARTVARQLRLDEDLAEALALAHDLGHPPFGHAGERALDTVMQPYGGFDHNAQSVRLVTKIERKYLAFDGLNLSWEMLEGLVKHNGPVTDKDAPVAKVVRDVETWQSLNLSDWASAEAQVASLADDIAYLSHDVDDGLRAGLLTLHSLSDLPLARSIADKILAIDHSAAEARQFYEVTRRMITQMIADLVTQSRENLHRLRPTSPDAIRTAGRPVIAFSDTMARDLVALKQGLFARVYHHPRVMEVMAAAEKVVTRLFERYRDLSVPSAMPEPWRENLHALDERQMARVVCDYIAGQTDRFAIVEHQRLFDETPDLRYGA